MLDTKVKFMRGLWVVVCSLAAGSLMGWSSLAVAKSMPKNYVERYIENQHYMPLRKALPPSADGGPSVLEFFSYGCPHCETLEKPLSAWLQTKPDQVAFERLPATWNPYFEKLGRLYFTLRALGKADSEDSKVFNYIHHQKKSLKKKSAIREFAVNQLGIEAGVFNETWNSDAVNAEMANAMATLRAAQVTGVPALIVNGRYKVSIVTAGSDEAVFDVVNFLLNNR